jgi:hypothetical protein
MHQELLQLFGQKKPAELDPSRLPDFMQRYLREASSCTDARPGLLLTAWLPFCAVNAGNRIHMYNNTGRIFPNIWSCVIGPSGIARKTTALTYARYCVRDYEQELREAPAQERSDRALVITNSTLSVLMSQLAANPSRLLLQNEFSGWSAEMAKTFNMGYKQHITDLFDSKDRVISTRERTEAINDPALSVATSSTEAWFMKHMASRADQLGGFLQRMLFFVVSDVDYAELDMEYRDVKALEERLAAYDAEYFHWWRNIPFSQRLELSPQARELRDSAYRERHRACFESRNDTLMSYFTRIYDGYWYKFCMLITLAKNRQAVAWFPSRLETGFPISLGPSRAPHVAQDSDPAEPRERQDPRRPKTAGLFGRLLRSLCREVLHAIWITDMKRLDSGSSPE